MYQWEELITVHKKRCKSLSWWNPLRWLCTLFYYVIHIANIIFLTLIFIVAFVTCVLIHGLDFEDIVGVPPEIPPVEPEEEEPEEAEPEQPFLLRRLRERTQKPRDVEKTPETPARTRSDCPHCLASAIALIGIGVYVLLRELTRQK